MSMARGEPFDMSLVLHRHPRTLVRSARGAHVQDGAHCGMALHIPRKVWCRKQTQSITCICPWHIIFLSMGPVRRTVMTTEECLLNANRNPHAQQGTDRADPEGTILASRR